MPYTADDLIAERYKRLGQRIRKNERRIRKIDALRVEPPPRPGIKGAFPDVNGGISGFAIATDHERNSNSFQVKVTRDPNWDWVLCEIPFHNISPPYLRLFDIETYKTLEESTRFGSSNLDDSALASADKIAYDGFKSDPRWIAITRGEGDHLRVIGKNVTATRVTDANREAHLWGITGGTSSGGFPKANNYLSDTVSGTGTITTDIDLTTESLWLIIGINTPWGWAYSLIFYDVFALAQSTDVLAPIYGKISNADKYIAFGRSDTKLTVKTDTTLSNTQVKLWKVPTDIGYRDGFNKFPSNAGAIKTFSSMSANVAMDTGILLTNTSDWIIVEVKYDTFFGDHYAWQLLKTQDPSRRFYLNSRFFIISWSNWKLTLKADANITNVTIKVYYI